MNWPNVKVVIIFCVIWHYQVTLHTFNPYYIIIHLPIQLASDTQTKLLQMVLDTQPLMIKSRLPQLSNQGMIRHLPRGQFQEEQKRLILIQRILEDHQTLCMYPMNQILKKEKLLNKRLIFLTTQVEFLSMHYFIASKIIIIIIAFNKGYQSLSLFC